MRSVAGITVLMLSILLVGPSWARESPLNITETKVEPSTLSQGSQALISCRVAHPEGHASIKRVAAVVSYEEWNTSYPRLYDDGTHGDRVAEDGIYSLEITAGDLPGELRIVFIAVDKDRNEIESEPVIVTVTS